MYFKVEKGTETFEKFQALKERVKEVNAAAAAVAEKHGAERWCGQRRVAFGGLGAIQLDVKPEGFRIEDKDQNLYSPSAKNKAACKEWSELPTIDYDEVNSIIGFKGMQTISTERGLSWVNCFGYTIYDDCVLITMDDKLKFTPIADTVEILASEYHRIKEANAETVNS